MLCVISSRVVPAMGVTIARSAPASAFSNEDFPTFGRPAITIVSPSRSNAPCRALRRISSSAQTCQPLDKRANRAGKLALERALRAARRCGRMGFDQVRNRFRLRQIKLVIQKSAARKFSRFGQTHAECLSGFKAPL